MSKKTIRLFVSVQMPPSIQKEIGNFEKELKEKKLCEGSYVDSAHAHLTLKFLGSIAQNAIPDIDKSLQTITYKTFPAQLGKIGWFETGPKIEIIYATIMSPPLASLAEEVDNVLRPWAPRENRMFVSHVTIVRVNKVLNNMKFLRFLANYQLKPVEFTIKNFSLVKSTLTESAAQHEMLKTYQLK